MENSKAGHMRLTVSCLFLCAVLHGATGISEPQLSSFDDFMTALLAKWRISGAALGVSHDGRLVLARGYGRDAAGRPIEPDSLFPIGPIAQALNHAASPQLVISPVGTVADVLRFANTLDGRRPPALLSPVNSQPMLPPDSDWWISGLFRQASSGVDVAVLFDAPPADPAFDSELKAGLAKAASSVRQWPSKDLFFDGPELFARDVVNGADYSGGRVSPGEIVVLYPSNAGPAELAGSQLNAEQRIATVTGETRVLFDGIPAPMASSVEGRIGAVVPYGIAGHRTTEIVVEYRGRRSPPITLPVVESTPAIYTLDASGKGQAAMLNETGCCNSIRNPAPRGTVTALYATGEGQTIPEGIDGDLSGHDRDPELPKPRLPVSVTVGGIPAEITYAGEAPHAVAGLLQVNFRIPPNAPVGDAVPLVLHVGDTRSVDGVTMAVRSEVQRVLVIESDAATRGQLTQILKSAGFEVFQAHNGQEAKSLASREPIDLVICSLALPEGERVSAIHAITVERPRVRIVALTAILDKAALRAADLLGAQAILRKPLASSTVAHRIRELLRSRPFPYVADQETIPSMIRPQ